MLRRFFLSLRHWHFGAGRRHMIRIDPWVVTIALGVAITCSGIGLLEFRLRPVVEELAAVQVQNRVTGDINAALSEINTDYNTLVTTQQDQQGAVLAVTTNMAAVNALRNQVADRVLSAVETIDVHELGVPLGSLLDMDLVWAKGPAIRVHSLVAGTADVQAHSEFTSAGINQTLHRILLDVNVPLTVILPGISVDTLVSVQVCVAETVIVGRVPQTMLSGLPRVGSQEG